MDCRVSKNMPTYKVRHCLRELAKSNPISFKIYKISALDAKTFREL